MLEKAPQVDIIPARPTGYEQIVTLVCDGVQSVHTRRAYRKALLDFLAWHEQAGRPALNKATLQAYVVFMREAGLGAASINVRLSAIRKLIAEAEDNNLLDTATAASARRVKGERKEGKRLGNWLGREQAQAFLDAPDCETLKGLRDRALLAVLVGCGLRRAEAAALDFAHIQQREGRWVIVDLVGKRNKTRSVPMPSWCKAAIDAYTQAADISAGYAFRPVNKGDHLAGESMTAQSIFETVKHYADGLGLAVAPHDLRRTFAKLARKGGADLKQIQLTLGHASVKTTEVYLGEEQNLTDAPCDRLGLKLNAD
jgi:site-specific recombinase XerD